MLLDPACARLSFIVWRVILVNLGFLELHSGFNVVVEPLARSATVTVAFYDFNRVNSFNAVYWRVIKRTGAAIAKAYFYYGLQLLSVHCLSSLGLIVITNIQNPAYEHS